MKRIVAFICSLCLVLPVMVTGASAKATTTCIGGNATTDFSSGNHTMQLLATGISGWYKYDDKSWMSDSSQEIARDRNIQNQTRSKIRYYYSIYVSSDSIEHIVIDPDPFWGPITLPSQIGKPFEVSFNTNDTVEYSASQVITKNIANEWNNTLTFSVTGSVGIFKVGAEDQISSSIKSTLETKYSSQITRTYSTTKSHSATYYTDKNRTPDACYALLREVIGRKVIMKITAYETINETSKKVNNVWKWVENNNSKTYITCPNKPIIFDDYLPDNNEMGKSDCCCLRVVQFDDLFDFYDYLNNRGK